MLPEFELNIASLNNYDKFANKLLKIYSKFIRDKKPAFGGAELVLVSFESPHISESKIQRYIHFNSLFFECGRAEFACVMFCMFL